MTGKKEWMKQIFQVVMVVDNLGETIDSWKRLVEFDQASIKMGATNRDVECIYKGEQIRCLTKYVTFELGGVEMKLVEPVNKEGGDPYSDSLIKSGPGIHHLGCYIEDYQGLLAKYTEAGRKPVYEEIFGDERYILYDFANETGLKIAPWDHMEGPCAR